MIYRFLFMFFLTFSLYATEDLAETTVPSTHSEENEEWELYRFNFYFENDLFSITDSQYSSGEKLNFIFRVDHPQSRFYDLLFLDYGDEDIYVSLSLANQIYTPEDLNETVLIPNDRPYSGWTYAEIGLHKSSSSHLRSIYLQVGMIGPYSFSEQIQKTIHKVTDSEPPMGWEHQLNNELGINLRYIHKWRFQPNTFYGIGTSFVPFVEGDLGNVAIQASAGMHMRIGWNVPQDFGVTSLDTGGEVGIPVKDGYKEMLHKNWSFTFNFNGAGSLVARDITLDGNTFSSSHSVEKNNFVGYLGYGFSLRYRHFIFEYIKNINSKKFTEEKQAHAVGTAVASWVF